MAKEKEGSGMKSALEIAMERLAKEEGAPKKLTGAQKEAIAEVERETASRVAETEILFSQKIAAVAAAGEAEAVEELKRQMQSDIARARDRGEAKKKKIRGE